MGIFSIVFNVIDFYVFKEKCKVLIIVFILIYREILYSVYYGLGYKYPIHRGSIDLKAS